MVKGIHHFYFVALQVNATGVSIRSPRACGTARGLRNKAVHSVVHAQNFVVNNRSRKEVPLILL